MKISFPSSAFCHCHRAQSLAHGKFLTTYFMEGFLGLAPSPGHHTNPQSDSNPVLLLGKWTYPQFLSHSHHSALLYHGIPPSIPCAGAWR